jgi:hypothetical protein
MKNLIFAFVLIFAAFFNACQENSITDPITHENVDKDINYYNNLNSNTIILNNWLLDPSQNPHTALQIIGTIDFGVSSNIGNQISVNNAYNTTVKMEINAELHSPVVIDGNSSLGYCVNKATVDYIMIDPYGQREYRLVKSYEISGCRDRICLECTFAVTTTRVILKDLKLRCVGPMIDPILIND